MVPSFCCLFVYEKSDHQIIEICVIHSIIVVLSLELAGRRDNGALLCQTQESCSQFRS